jgi:Mannosyltransferase (PIG-V)
MQPAWAGQAAFSRAIGSSLLQADTWRRYAPVVAAYGLSRAVVVLAAVVVEAGLIGSNPRLVHGDPAPILGSLTTWDGDWFLHIAQGGYHLEPKPGSSYLDYAFFPLYPALVHLLSMMAPQFLALAAVALNWVLFGIALALLVRLARPILGEARAIRAAALLAISPFSFVYAMAYSEPLTLVLVVIAFLFSERRQPLSTGIAFALASLTRAQAAFYLIPLALASKLSGPKRLRWVALGLGPLATLAYLGWVALFTGHLNGYFASYAAWGRNSGGAAAGAGSVGQAINGPLAYYFAILLVCLVVAVGLFVFVRVDRIPLAYVAIPAISLVMLLVSGSLEAIGRVVLLAFPYYWILASRQHIAWRKGWPILSICLLAYFSALTFAGWWIP